MKEKGRRGVKFKNILKEKDERREREHVNVKERGGSVCRKVEVICVGRDRGG